MATTRRRTLTEKNLPYRVAGDPRDYRYMTLGHAISAAIAIAERGHPRDGEEYRHGIFCHDEKVAVVVRNTDGTITASGTGKP